MLDGVSVGLAMLRRAMTDEQFDEVLAALRAGREFRVRDMDGEWGIRGVADGFECWSHVPYEAESAPVHLDEAGVRQHLGAWDLARVMAALR